MFETLRTALSSLLANKTRSLLTMLGVVIGVGAVIAMVAVGNGASVQMQDLVSGLGSNLLILSPGAPRSGGVRQSSGARLTLSDVRAVTEECWSVLRAAPLVNLSAQLIYENQNWPTRVTGTTPSFFDVDNRSIYLAKASECVSPVRLDGAFRMVGRRLACRDADKKRQTLLLRLQ